MMYNNIPINIITHTHTVCTGTCAYTGIDNLSIVRDGSIDLADKDVGGIEADGPGEEPESQHHNHGVAEIEHGRYDTHYLQL